MFSKKLSTVFMNSSPEEKVKILNKLNPSDQLSQLFFDHLLINNQSPMHLGKLYNQIKNKEYQRQILCDFSEMYSYKFSHIDDGFKNNVEVQNHHFEYIPFDPHHFIQDISLIKNKFNLDSFIDVGCGVGDKVLLAKYFLNFKKASGIELNKLTYALFTTFGGYHLDTYTLMGFNINAFDFKEYENYDLIYLFMPIASKERMRDLCKFIFSQMKIGGFYYEAIGSYNYLLDVMGVKDRLYGKRYSNLIEKTGKNKFEFVDYSVDIEGEY